jgi:hypothetical protein
MEGKIKITVIATGFDHARASTAAAQASKTTPVDMSAYASVKVQTEERQVANGGRVLVARRPVLNLPGLAARPAVAAAPSDSAENPDEASPLDVPAFLRRHEN